ncbi:hypothetical protein MY04_3321 [Flammeovirga sp. MY04]|uniref:hypothetical protein n=1 Tax=Flammeovirga sp. MY04 TaxID=1191459 RepID=UPI0008063DB3|nr:hypothetical protein [Flammeovirga sp. MY04]ANQ50683.1 hypothetical protein MY04_3321 [Flammeovirga sp. MY04]
MRKILFVLFLLICTAFSVKAQGKKKGHDKCKHNHHCHHHKKKKKKPKKHHHGKECKHHHHDYTYVIIQNPRNQAQQDMNSISLNVGLSSSQKKQIEQAYFNFYMSINTHIDLKEEDRKKKCKELEKKRDNNIHQVLSQTQFNLYTSFLKTWK